MKRISFSAALVAASMFAHANTITPKVIYGEDNRRDVYVEERADIREIADSTAAMIPTSKLTANNSRVRIAVKNYGEEMGLCKDEPFYGQPTAANCSAFLVGDDLVATAGHCINKATCKDKSFVFGFKMHSSTVGTTDVAAEEVYNCKDVTAYGFTRNEDYALVKLDRPVRGHRVLTLAKEQAKAKDPIMVIGHPSGLPTKIADGANIRKLERGYFVANLDTYGGNSGSAVFNASTLEVVGILVRGEEDFSYDSARQCRLSNKCGDSQCRGEDVTFIKYIADALSAK